MGVWGWTKFKACRADWWPVLISMDVIVLTPKSSGWKHMRFFCDTGLRQKYDFFCKYQSLLQTPSVPWVRPTHVMENHRLSGPALTSGCTGPKMAADTT